MSQTYDNFIQNILNTRGRFECGEKYHERHHIIPKCMGGDNSLENLIDLYAREHFIAHQLLSQENPENQKLAYAWWRMCNIENKSKEIYGISPEEYEEARIKFSDISSQKMKGENNPNYGKPTWTKGRHLSEETRRKLSESHKGKVLSEETRKKISEKQTRKATSKETRIKMSESAKKSWTEERRINQCGENNPMFGKIHAEETRKKIGLANKNAWTEERQKKQSEISSKMNRGENHPMWGKKHTEETRKKISEAHKGAKHPCAKQVIRLIDGKIYECGKYAAEENQINYETFKCKCRKHDEFMYYDEWLTLQNDYEGEKYNDGF
jgi:hypothetical protein